MDPTNIFFAQARNECPRVASFRSARSRALWRELRHALVSGLHAAEPRNTVSSSAKFCCSRCGFHRMLGVLRLESSVIDRPCTRTRTRTLVLFSSLLFSSPPPHPVLLDVHTHTHTRSLLFAPLLFSSSTSCPVGQDRQSSLTVSFIYPSES